MKVPDEFPDGCLFVPTFGGDWFVMFPDGDWFKVSDDESELLPRPLMPKGKAGAPAGGIAFNTSPPAFKRSVTAP